MKWCSRGLSKANCKEFQNMSFKIDSRYFLLENSEAGEGE